MLPWHFTYSTPVIYLFTNSVQIYSENKEYWAILLTVCMCIFLKDVTKVVVIYFQISCLGVDRKTFPPIQLGLGIASLVSAVGGSWWGEYQ